MHQDLPTIAVIDMGTNTFNLVIARINAFHKPEVLIKDRIPAKIGKGGIQNKIITEQGYNRALKAMHHYRLVLDKYNVKNVQAIATSAFRNATNGRELADKITEECDIPINIIDGDQEAQLIYEGVSNSFKMGEKPSMIMDVGGGSVEFIICNETEIFWKQSFEIGVQRLYTLFHHSEPIEQNEIEEVQNHADAVLEDLFKAIKTYKPKRLIGSSGAFDTLCEIAYKKTGKILLFDAKHEFDLPIEDFVDVHDLLVAKTKEERLNVPGMASMRVELIVVGVILIQHILNRGGFKKITVSSYALREGALFRSIKDILKEEGITQEP